MTRGLKRLVLVILPCQLLVWLIKFVTLQNEGVQVNLAGLFMHQTMTCALASWRSTGPFQLKKLFAAIEYYIETTNRRVTFEYIMLNEVNDGVEQALELAELLKNIKKLSYVNLIPLQSCQWAWPI